MQSSLLLCERIHQKALDLSRRYKSAEVELIDVLIQAERHRVFRRKGHPSLFRYVVDELRLSEGVAYNLITVSRKAREVPELQAKIRDGAITLTNARKIAPVLEPENKNEWLAKAAMLSQRQLEREVVKIRPEAATPERASYVTESRMKLEIGLSEKAMMNLRRAQDVLAQARGRPVTLEETVAAMTDEFLHRRDPVERAKRQWVRKGLQSPKIEPVALQAGNEHQRTSVPAAVLHQVRLRDQGRCTRINAQGRRCNQSRWVEIHHKIPVSRGGPNTAENLTTLCSGCHDLTHLDLGGQRASKEKANSPRGYPSRTPLPAAASVPPIGRVPVETPP
jgi:5-methylcytosine-specific restriction endonuclease McrA